MSVCVCVIASRIGVCVCMCACMRNGRSREVIRPLAKYYCFLWAMAILGHRKAHRVPSEVASITLVWARQTLHALKAGGGCDRQDQLGLPVTSVAGEVA